MTDRVATRQAEVLARVLDAERVDLHTAIPGEIVSYNTDTQTADIRVTVRRSLPAADEDDPDVFEDFPILPSVPLLWPRSTGGGGFLHIPLQAGDGVLVIFSEADITRWRETGEVSDPGVPQRHGLSGAYAVPGAHWRGNPNADASSLEGPALGIEGGPRVEITPSQVLAGGSDALALAIDVRAHLQAIETTLLSLSGSATFGTPYNRAALLATTAPIDTTTTRGA